MATTASTEADQPPTKKQKTTTTNITLTISNLPTNKSVEQLSSIFQPFGPIQSFLLDPTNPAIGHLTFLSESSVPLALRLNGIDLGFGAPIGVHRHTTTATTATANATTATTTLAHSTIISSHPMLQETQQDVAVTTNTANTTHRANNNQSDEGKLGPCIGIDLGTTYSCVGVWRNNTVEIIPNDHGNRTTPSYVCFSEDGSVVVGETAKSSAAVYPTNTIFDAKRLIGRKFEDPVVKADCKQWAFRVTGTQSKGKKGQAVIHVNHKGKERVLRPEEISSMVLGKMKTIAEKYLGCAVHRAVITVPAYFTDAQRAATKTAGAIAGLQVLRIINEPTAAAIAYGLDKQDRRGERHVLVFDMGGGTFDVTLLALEKGCFEVRATAGDTHLGGEDFDNILVDHFIQEFQKTYTSPVQLSKQSSRKLRTACEGAKRILSTKMTTTIHIDSFFNGEDLTVELSREHFEYLCRDWFEKAIEPLAKVLLDAKMNKDDVHEIVLVGGSTRIPKVRTMLSSYFNNKDLNMSINADEAVAFGAAVQGAILTGKTGSQLNNLLLLDVLPLSVGVETSGGVMTTLIPRNTTVPVRKIHYFTTAVENQKAVTVQIYEGEHQLTKHCHKLGEFTLENLPEMGRGVPQIEVVLAVDGDGILHVKATETSTGGGGVAIQISNDRDQLSTDEIELLVQEAEASRAEDDIIAEHGATRNGLNNLAYAMNKNIIKHKKLFKQLTTDEQNDLKNIVMTTADWLGDLEDVVDMSLKEKVQEMKDIHKTKLQLMAVAEPILVKLNVVMSSTGERSGVLDLKGNHFNGFQRGPSGVVVENVDG